MKQVIVVFLILIVIIELAPLSPAFGNGRSIQRRKYTDETSLKVDELIRRIENDFEPISIGKNEPPMKLNLEQLMCKANVLRKVDIIPGGERLTLHSKILDEDRTVFVSLPASYPRGGQRYPVLYLTDAQWQFDQTRSTVDFLARNRIIPEMIIVGVVNSDRTRDLYSTKADFKRNGQTIPFPTSGNGDQFLEFFEKELIPWTEAAYRTVPFRILAGHSAGGNFALHTIRVKPSLFQAVMVASPWLAWDDRRELKELVPFLASAKILARTLFITFADEGPEMKADIDAVTGALRSRKDASVRWDSAAYPNESHDSEVIKSYYDAMRMIFAEWSYPRDPQTNFLTGSLDDVKSHYAKLGDRLGFALFPPETVVNELGYQYLKMNNLDSAIGAFRFNTVQYPLSANVWDSLGEAYLKAKDKEHSLAAYRRSLELDPKNENAKRVIELIGKTR